ncbi:MAG: SecC motif-containing protein [Colwellia sp.]|nr:SecC motif-containing protein [Colwellia sp.]
MPLNNLCFCGSTQRFSCCCQLLIEQKAFPQTPEQLMRSRFSAYVVGNSPYIYATYAKSSQASQSLKEIDDWSNSCTWIALHIHSGSDIAQIDSPEQFVEFSAFYVANNTLCELRENSRFIVEINTTNENQNPHWCYLDGDIIKHSELAQITRKELCPCNNYPTAWTIKKKKKFKQCCGR